MLVVDYLPTCIIDDIFYSVWCAHAIDWNKYFCWLWRQWILQHCKQGHHLNSGEITVYSQITFIHIIFSIIDKTQTEFIFKGKRHDFKAISKELSGKYISLVIPQQSDSEKMCQSERLMKLRNGYRLKRSHFTPHLSDVTLSGPRARLVLFGGSNTTQFCGWHRRIQHSCYKFHYISPYWRWMK